MRISQLRIQGGVHGGEHGGVHGGEHGGVHGGEHGGVHGGEHDCLMRYRSRGDKKKKMVVFLFPYFFFFFSLPFGIARAKRVETLLGLSV